MSRLQQELQQRIHDSLCGEVNKMMIRLKINSDLLYDSQSEGQKVLMRESRKQYSKPTDDEIIDLFEKCFVEMNQCTKPFKVR